MAYRTAAIQMTLSDLQCHSAIASLSDGIFVNLRSSVKRFQLMNIARNAVPVQ